MGIMCRIHIESGPGQELIFFLINIIMKQFKMGTCYRFLTLCSKYTKNKAKQETAQNYERHLQFYSCRIVLCTKSLGNHYDLNPHQWAMSETCHKAHLQHLLLSQCWLSASPHRVRATQRTDERHPEFQVGAKQQSCTLRHRGDSMAPEA